MAHGEYKKLCPKCEAAYLRLHSTLKGWQVTECPNPRCNYRVTEMTKEEPHGMVEKS